MKKTRVPSKKAAPKKAAARSAKPKAPRAKRPAKSATPAATPVAPRPAQVFPKLLVDVVRALDAKKVGDLQVLYVGELSSITDYLVLGNATSQPHLRALRVELEKVIDAQGAPILGMDVGQESGWTVVDAFDVMIHLFTPENRAKYRLELLWRDAQSVPLTALV
jgi:ribosome-associated protein